MATSGALEDMVTCPICQELFVNPLALTCLHTLCTICVSDLKKSATNKHYIECPICREYSKIKALKKDFKTHSLVELYQNEGKNLYKGVTYKISCCFCSGKLVSWKCDECDTYICHSCRYSHLQIPACRTHKLIQMQDVYHEKILKLKSLLNIFESKSKTVQTQIATLSQYNDKVKHLEEILHSDVDDFKIQIFENIEKHCLSIKEEISIRIHKENDQVSHEQLKFIEGISRDIQDEKELLQTLIKDNDPVVVLNNADNLTKTLSTKLSNSYEIPHCLPLPKPRDIKVVKRNLKYLHEHLKEYIQVHIPEKPCSQIQGLSRKINTKLLCWTDVSLEVKQELNIHCNDCNSINYINHQIWCIYDKRVVIFNKNGKFLKAITTIQNGRAISGLKQGYIIVACAGKNDSENGLMLYNEMGRFIKCLYIGKFIDLDRIQNETSTIIVALEHELSEIKLFQTTINGSQVHLECLTSIKPELEISMADTVCCVSATQYMVASFFYNCVTKYTITGDTLSKYDNETSNQRFKNPRLCCSDTNGNIVLINFGSPQQSPFIFDSAGYMHQMKPEIMPGNHKKKASENKFKPETKCLHVSVDNENNLWILQTKNQPSSLGVEQYSINKYSIKIKPSCLYQILCSQVLVFVLLLFTVVILPSKYIHVCGGLWIINVILFYCFHAKCF